LRRRIGGSGSVREEYVEAVRRVEHARGRAGRIGDPVLPHEGLGGRIMKTPLGKLGWK
jgi:hypothetical protein